MYMYTAAMYTSTTNIRYSEFYQCTNLMRILLFDLFGDVGFKD